MRNAKLSFILAAAAGVVCLPQLRLDPVNAATYGSAPAKASSTGSSARPVIACFGDSLTAGAGIDPEQAFPAVLQRLLDQQGYGYRVVNDGVSGNTTKDGVDRLDEVLEQHPQVVIVEFGGNDGLRGLSTTEAERNLATMVSKLKASGAKVALAGITLPAQYGGPYIQSFNAMFPTVATRYHVPLLPFILQDVYGVPGYIQDDGIHPTARGAQQVAVNVEHLVLPLLHK